MKTNFFLLVATICLVIACNKVKPPDISYDTGFEQIVDYKFILNANCDTAIIPELPEINQGYIVHEDATNVKFASFNPNNSNEIVYCRKSNGATKEINVYDRQNLLNVFPNPCNKNFYIEFLSDNSKKAIIKVYNTLGQIVINYIAATTSPNRISINTSYLPNGIYQVMIETGDNKYSTKLIVQH